MIEETCPERIVEQAVEDFPTTIFNALRPLNEVGDQACLL